MKIKSTIPENIKSIINPEDSASTAKSEKGSANSQISTGVGSVKGGFELARSQTTLDKMIECKKLLTNLTNPERGKVRESAAEVKNILIASDQFSINKKGQNAVQQNQAETLKSQTQNVKTDGSVKFALEKLETRAIIDPQDSPVQALLNNTPEVDECIMKAPGVDGIVEPED